MNITHFISISFSEFQAWYSSGELRLSIHRLVAVPVDNADLPVLSDLQAQHILELLPHVDLENEHSLILVRVNCDAAPLPTCISARQVSIALEMTYIPSNAIVSIHPLSDRAARLLASRLDGYNIRLSTPLPEVNLDALWTEWAQRRAAAGASALLAMAVADSKFMPTPLLQDEAFGALHEANQQNTCPLQSKGLLANAVCYERHDPLSEDDIGFLQDLAVILKKRYEADPAMETVRRSLRDLCKDKEFAKKTLVEILTAEPVVQVFATCVSLTECPATMQSIALFLQWKYTTQRKGSVSLDAIFKSVRNASGKLPPESIEQALWLFGLFCGFDRFAADYYARTSTQHRFLSQHIEHRPCILEEPHPQAPPILSPQSAEQLPPITGNTAPMPSPETETAVVLIEPEKRAYSPLESSDPKEAPKIPPKEEKKSRAKGEKDNTDKKRTSVRTKSHPDKSATQTQELKL
jgi:hypothetical protein